MSIRRSARLARFSLAAGVMLAGALHPTIAAAQSTPVHALTLTPTPTRSATPTASATATATPTATPPPLPLVADANCDGRGTAADFCAAILVSGDASKLPGCAGADVFRGRRLTEQDIVALLADVFETFAAPPTPTISPTATITPTSNGTHTATRTMPPSTTPTVSATATQTATATPTPTETATKVPTFTPTATFTRTPTITRTATPTATPTGLAYQLSGEWLAHWSGQICFLNGLPFNRLQDTIYRVTAIDGRLDVEIKDGARLGRALTLDGNNTVQTTYRVFDQRVCLINARQQEYVFDYTFTLRTNGTGSATAHWTYAFNTNCATCEVTDTAALVRIAGPR